MKGNLRTKLMVIAGVVAVCLFGLFGFTKDSKGSTRLSFPTSGQMLSKNLSDRINLGLDLRGGMHLILRVEVEEAVNAEMDQLRERIRNLFAVEDIKYESIPPKPANDPNSRTVRVEGVQADQLTLASDILNDNYGRGGSYTISRLAGELSGFALEMTSAFESQTKQDALRNSMGTIRQRVDGLGVSEPVIAEHGRGEWEILVQLPGVDDPNRVKSILRSTAMLELKLVEGGPFETESSARSTDGLLPRGTELLPGVEDGRTVWYLVSRSSVVTGSDLRNARAEADTQRPGLYVASFTLSNDGASRFGPFTERNIGRPMAVVLDHRIQQVATINSRIDDRGQIEGRYTLQEAQDLALVLRSGSLPASIRYLEERTVGPSLGADSIRSGLAAVLTGLAAVVGFMLFYYRLSGINAVVALVLNLLMLLAALAYVGATLTLPGIAGVLLTIGMAVDANVLIFERIREELRAGKSVVAAVENGFDRAFVTIFDTNATTIIAAFFLYSFGAGPIRGFAVTLTAGLLANLFAAVYVSRTIFEYLLSRKERPTALSI